MPKKIYVAFDQGTNSRAIVLDHDANVVSIAQKNLLKYILNRVGLSMTLWKFGQHTSAVWVEALAQAGIKSEQVAAIGITNQRETTVVWDKKTGKPIYNAIVWQSRQTTEICNQLHKAGWQEYIRKTTGLVIDPYFRPQKLNGF